jgi:ArsR family transcriptional regulator
MSINKKGEYLKDELLISDFVRSLGHPARIAILKILAERGTCVNGDINAGLVLSQSTINQHLKELKRIGLIKGHLNGSKAAYCIDWDKFEKYNALYMEFSQNIKKTKSENINC